MGKHFATGLVLFGLMTMVAGCTSYYRVTDPASGKTYYTTEMKDAGRGGAVKIKDAKSGSMVTLQSSEVKEISEEEYEAALKAPSMKATAPMPSAEKATAPMPSAEKATAPMPPAEPQPAAK
ncbi:protein of unknown function [Nitrospira japonica]|uniref:Lipoprotein n=1 Tax=Nitrospira japonica TaxID=1325564 RepID=A0A1W1I7P7_9BACT|nr:hypothetical protein [Nitrospira japonica]SLM49037.1 protein of unknown function [Nitrospira japonica]